MKRFKKFIKYYFILCAIMEVYLFRHVLITSFYDTPCMYKPYIDRSMDGFTLYDYSSYCIYWQAVAFIAYRYTFLLLVPIYIWTFLKIRSSPDEPFFKPLTPAVTWTLFYIFTCHLFASVDWISLKTYASFSVKNIFNLRLDLIFYVLSHPKGFIDFIISRLS